MSAQLSLLDAPAAPAVGDRVVCVGGFDHRPIPGVRGVVVDVRTDALVSHLVRWDQTPQALRLREEAEVCLYAPADLIPEHQAPAPGRQHEQLAELLRPVPPLRMGHPRRQGHLRAGRHARLLRRPARGLGARRGAHHHRRPGGHSMSTESKFPKIDWPLFDHSMTAGEHVKFEIYQKRNSGKTA